MKGYLRKVLCIFAGIFFVTNFGLIVSWGYLMSNSPGQMRFFCATSFLVWLFWLIMGLIILAFMAMPVVSGMRNLHENTLGDSELMPLIRRNSLLPIAGCAIAVAMLYLLCFTLHTVYGKYDIGRIASIQIWALGIPASLAYCIVMFGAVSLVTNPCIDILRNECARRRIPYPVKPTKLQTKLWVVFLMLFAAIITWMGMIGFYEGINRVQEDYKEYIVNAQQAVLRQTGLNAGRTVDLDRLKKITNDLILTGIGPSFITDRGGRVIYNPRGAEVYNEKWNDINDQIRDKIRQGAPWSLYENIHEQVIAFSPVNESYSIGTARTIHDRMASFRKFFIMGALLTSLALFVILAAGFTLFRSIAIPINETIEKLMNISRGEGDLTVRMSVMSHDDTGTLAKNFNVFVEYLNQMVASMKKIAMNLNTGSTEVELGSQNLSNSMQQQAVAVEEIVATINEMTVSIKQNSANASDGNEKVRQLVDFASVIEKMSQGLVLSMSEISMSSQKIYDIISTVDQVAFQTNILALNAAVEAARAGEHGKGFAVVAQEVRALSQRTTEAAGNIKVIIQDMLEKISNGGENVQKSEESIRKIISQIREVSQSMHEIAAASSEQATSMSELNDAIITIDASTQTATSTAIELANTSENLKIETDNLNRHVGRFKVTEPENLGCCMADGVAS